MSHTVKILSTHKVLYNVRQFNVEKPKDFTFTPGQAVDLSINQPEWKDKKNPFTFTALEEDPYLQFTIKIYPDHEEGVTKHLDTLVPGDEFIISDAWGAIEYKGPGYFIAGGAGITPFIAILRRLHQDNRIGANFLYFSNRTSEDIILKDELELIMGSNIHFVTTDEDGKGDHRKINMDFLKDEGVDLKKHFYVCGPDEMVKDLSEALGKLGVKADSVVFEK
jgi:ferredoxin-NADP reductase